jgi:hypothetical protein
MTKEKGRMEINVQKDTYLLQGRNKDNSRGGGSHSSGRGGPEYLLRRLRLRIFLLIALEYSG